MALTYSHSSNMELGSEVMSRWFSVVFRSPWLAKEGLDGVNKVLSQGLGYRLLGSTPRSSSWEKGSKIATYAGLVNWQLLYRRLLVEIVKSGTLRFTYRFSWLTNVGVLVSAARHELGYLQEAFHAQQFEVERFR